MNVTVVYLERYENVGPYSTKNTGVENNEVTRGIYGGPDSKEANTLLKQAKRRK